MAARTPLRLVAEANRNGLLPLPGLVRLLREEEQQGRGLGRIRWGHEGKRGEGLDTNQRNANGAFRQQHGLLLCSPGAHTRGMSSSAKPGAPLYSGPSIKKPSGITVRDLPGIARRFKESPPPSSSDGTGTNKPTRLVCLTAYDYPTAAQGDAAGVDILLVGDSVAMVVHGHDTTVPISLDTMILHTQAVVRGAQTSLVVADMPFGSYECSSKDAVRNAVRMMKEGGADAVKIEGGSGARLEAMSKITSAGIACFGHVGLTPQSISALGGFRPHGKSAREALRIVEEAKQLERHGACALVVECVPAVVAAAVTAAVTIPTIGIGAGPHTTGQILVYHDLLGMMSHPHHQQATPKFCKHYAKVGEVIHEALVEYGKEVRDGAYPCDAYSPYNISAEELTAFEEGLEQRGSSRGRNIT